MRIHDGPSAIELLEYRIEDRIAQPLPAVDGEQAETVCLERIEGVLELFQARVDVGQRKRGHEAEPSGVVRREPRCIFVTFPGEANGRGGIIERIARRRDRAHARGHAALVHLLESLGRRPGRLTACATSGAERLQQSRRYDVMVDVDPAGKRARGR